MYRRVYCTTLKINNLFFILKKKTVFLFVLNNRMHVYVYLRT